MTQPNHSTAGSPASLTEHPVDGQGRNGSSVLLELEPQQTPIIEKSEQNPTALTDLDNQPCYAPLLGTSYSQSTEITEGSSKRRSPESVCYNKLLRESGPSSGRKSQKTVNVGGRDC